MPDRRINDRLSSVHCTPTDSSAIAHILDVKGARHTELVAHGRDTRPGDDVDELVREYDRHDRVEIGWCLIRASSPVC